MLSKYYHNLFNYISTFMYRLEYQLYIDCGTNYHFIERLKVKKKLDISRI